MKQQNFIHFYSFMKTVPDMYYAMPKFLFKEEFDCLSAEAKMLYTCLLDRLTLAVKENWKDEEDRLYVYYTIAQATKVLGVSKNTAHKAFVELKDIGLIDVIRQGHCKPSKILVKTVMPAIDYEKHRLKVWESED